MPAKSSSVGATVRRVGVAGVVLAAPAAVLGAGDAVFTGGHVFATGHPVADIALGVVAVAGGAYGATRAHSTMKRHDTGGLVKRTATRSKGLEE